jgi:hypothetical protein
LILTGCQGNDDQGAIIAKVGEKALYESDLSSLNWTKSDSAQVVDQYVRQWIEQEILMQAAEKEEEIKTNRIERQVEEYRKELYIHQLMKLRVEAALDTTVSDEEIQSFYDDHKADFQLNDYLVKVLYLKVPLDAPDLEEIGSAYKLQHEGDQEKVELFAQMYASNFYYDVDNWIYFDDILKEIPLQDINKDRFILKRSKIRFEENGFYYFLNIIDYKLKNTLSPLNFERANIKTRILNMRMKDLRGKIENEIIKSAYDSGEVQYP